MGGRMYLGNQLVTPTIIVGNTEPAPFGGYRIENGVAISNNGYTLTGHEFDGITEIGENALRRVFEINGSDSVYLNGELSFRNLKTIKKAGLFLAFAGQAVMKIGSFNTLETIEEDGMLYCFWDVSSSEYYEEEFSISFSKLKKIGTRGMKGCFSGAQFDTVRFDSLDDVGDSALNETFDYCSVNEIYFNSLKTTSFNGYTNAFVAMLPRTEVTVHFPSNLESTIQGLQGYPLFGGRSGYVTLAFDLPATS